MNLTYIDVDVHCIEPRWVADENSRYRLYINDELLTERDWIWSQDTYIHENIIVELSPGLSYTVRVEVIKSNPTYLTRLALQNLRINGAHKNDTNNLSDTITFVLA